MDINHLHNLKNTTWELNLAMADHVLHDQLSFDTAWPNYSLQPHQPSSSSNPIPTSSLYIDQIGTDHTNMALEGVELEEEEELGAMKEMMYKIAAMQPVDIDPATVRKPKRRNVRISLDPQSVAARHRRERISEKMRILQRLVPGGTKMDTASMLDEAIRYVKFLKRQIRQLQSNPNPNPQFVGVRGSDWPVSMEPPPAGGGSGGDGGAVGDTTWFNHEVISD